MNEHGPRFLAVPGCSERRAKLDAAVGRYRSIYPEESTCCQARRLSPPTGFPNSEAFLCIEMYLLTKRMLAAVALINRSANGDTGRAAHDEVQAGAYIHRAE